VFTLAAFLRSAGLAAIALCLSAAILRADEARPIASSHLQCRMYFGCLPVLSKEHGHVRQY
jgi:hypothetical protein